MVTHAYIGASNEAAYFCPAAAMSQHMVDERRKFLTAYSATYIAQDSDRAVELDRALLEDVEAANEGTAIHKHMFDVLNEDGDFSEVEERILKDYPDMDEFIIKQAERLFAEYQGEAGDAKYESIVINTGINSHGYCDRYHMDDTMLVVRDLKTGRVPVSAYKNPQIMRYASGIAVALEREGVEIKTVKLCIDGLRFASSTWTISRAELMQWCDTHMISSIVGGTGLAPRPAPGDHCRYCSANAVCPAAYNSVEKHLEQLDMPLADMPIAALEERYLALETAEEILKATYKEIMLRVSVALERDKCLKATKIQLGARRKIWLDHKAFYEQHGCDAKLAIHDSEGLLLPSKKLHDMFSYNADAKGLLTNFDSGILTESQLVAALKSLAKSGQLFFAKKPCTPSKARQLVGEEALEDHVLVVRNKSSILRR